ncbi:MAG: hypothetical protein LBF65_01845 [Holosporales bacterium]|jgi:hypothetical protein|nr:hypothetical protein [Holosporales bacterium]
MEILQHDIFGEKHSLESEKKPKKTVTAGSPRTYRDITMADGLLETVAAADAMLIHRILQRKVSFTNLSTAKQKQAFLRIFMNEVMIKSGEISAPTASRDSIISFFTMRE